MAARLPYSSMAGRIAPQLLKALDQMQYQQMTLVQEKVLAMPSFDRDCLVQARTGTGKTIAFLLPALQTLITAKNLSLSHVALLVLAPTRELAQQIADECDRLTSLLQPRLECHVAVGGSNKTSLLNKFMRGKPTILVATPGRLIDYLSDSATREKFSKTRIVVLDEADRMLDQGFAPSLIKILHSLPPKATAGWQGMCFSATMPPAINKVLHLVLKSDHVRITTIEEGGEPTVDRIPQSVIPVPSIDDVLPALHSLLAAEQANGPLKAVVFCSTARQAGLLYQVFAAPGNAAPGRLPVFQMHSRLSQPARNRTVEEFKVTTSGVMFASDVVGRGMDFPDISVVVQIGLPSDSEQYVHRVGRTGRAGKLGRAVMILIPEEMRFLQKNPEFPIKTAGLPRVDGVSSKEIIERALTQVPEASKNQAYVSFLGFTKTLTKVHGLAPVGIVALANKYSASLGLESPPFLEARTVGKMGLKGVPGLNIESGRAGGGGGGGRNGGGGGGGNSFGGSGFGGGRGGGGAGGRGGRGGFGGARGGGGQNGGASNGGFGGPSFGGSSFGGGAPASRGGGGQNGGGGPNKKRTFSKRD